MIRDTSSRDDVKRFSECSVNKKELVGEAGQWKKWLKVSGQLSMTVEQKGQSGGKRSGYVGALRIKLAELRQQYSSMELESSLLSVRRSSLNIESPMDMASESSE